MCVPCAVLRAAVDVGSVLQQVLDDVDPAAGARFVQGAVTGVVTVIHVTHFILQTVQHHLLHKEKGRGQERVHLQGALYSLAVEATYSYFHFS